MVLLALPRQPTLWQTMHSALACRPVTSGDGCVLRSVQSKLSYVSSNRESQVSILTAVTLGFLHMCTCTCLVYCRACALSGGGGGTAAGCLTREGYAKLCKVVSAAG